MIERDIHLACPLGPSGLYVPAHPLAYLKRRRLNITLEFSSTQGTHYASVGLVPQRVPSDPEILVVDASEEAGVHDFRGVPCLNLPETGCEIRSRVAGHDLIPGRLEGAHGQAWAGGANH